MIDEVDLCEVCELKLRREAVVLLSGLRMKLIQMGGARLFE